MHIPLRPARLSLTCVGALAILAACGNGTGPDPEPAVAAEVATNPEFVTVNVGASQQLGAEVRDASGTLIQGADVSWASLSGAVATVAPVSGSAVVSGVGTGVTRVTATSGTASDTTWVATVAPNSLLSTGFIGQRPAATVGRGQTITVPVTLDMSRVSANGDLGSVRFELNYNPALLTFQGASAGVAGDVVSTVPAAGNFRFVFNGTVPQGSPNLTLVTLTFQVQQSAPLDSYSVMTINYTAQPTSTTGQGYTAPVAVWGRFRVAQ